MKQVSKPRIGILHYALPPVIGGVEKVIADHAGLLVDAGYPVTLLTGRGGEGGRIPSEADIRLIPELDSEHAENRDLVQVLAQGRTTPAFDRLRNRIRKLLFANLGDIQLLIVHNVLNTHFNLPLTAALYDLVDQRSAPRTVAWCHDISRYVNPASGAEQRLGFPWDLFRTYDPLLHYVAVSERRQQVLAQVLKVSPEQIRVIPNGVSPADLLGLGLVGRSVFKGQALDQADFILLMPVRITQAKNIELALQVTAALKQLRVAPKLIITGPPDPHAQDSEEYFHRLTALRDSLGLEREAVFLYQDMPGADLRAGEWVAQMYRLADIVFMPSHREGFGLPVLEGGLVGCAVFATAIPVVDEVGAAAIHLIAPDETPEDIARRMRAWGEQSAEYRLRKRVRQNYTWPAIFDRGIEPLIHECLLASREQP